MKKIYLSLLLTTNAVFVSCMEKERYHTVLTHVIPNTNTSIMLNPSQQNNRPCCEANEPGWEFLDNIQNTNYTSPQSQPKQSQCMEEFELKPIYKPANTTVTQQEQKSLLLTNSLQPDETVMKELYKKAANIIAVEYQNVCQRQHLNDLYVQLITHMNNAKNNGLYEDLMGKFAYEKTDKWSIYRYDRGIHGDTTNIAPVIPIMFILLKKYNTTIHQTGEQIPLHFDTSTHANQHVPFFCQPNVGNDIIQYPAFFQLHYTVSRTVKDLSFDSIETFIKYLYENNDISQEGYSDGSYKDLKNEFYQNAYHYLFSNSTSYNLYSLLQIINKAKELHEIHDENDLITYIDPVNKPTRAQIFGWFSSSHSDDNVKNRITLLCELIKEYNRARDYKLTPTVAQYYTYYVKRFLNIPLPEPVCNNTHLDDTFYAFEEFEQLRTATDKLRKLTIEQVNEQIKDLKK